MMEQVYEYQGQMLTIAQLVVLATNGISKKTLRYRLKHGFDLETALTKPVSKVHAPKNDVLPCGATSPYDCLECKHKDMPCLTQFRPLKGESTMDCEFADYGKR